VSGTYYLPATSQELNVVRSFRDKVSSITKALRQRVFSAPNSFVVSTQSSTDLAAVCADSVDYIFTDPPFGDNLMYSELNFLWEAWLRAFTNNNSEAVVSRFQGKDLDTYRGLMIRCFSEMYRVLKPGRWITVVFHNSKASVWNAIQEALARAGFLVAQVTVLDKKQGSFKQVTAPGAVKNDLVINAYKPRSGFSQRFLSRAGQDMEPEFALEHVRRLPVTANVERSKEMLYSKYLAYYVQHGYQVAYNAEQFYRALPQWGLVERDNYWFAEEGQANEYEKRKVKGGKKTLSAQAVLFISDERSARRWLWDFLTTSRRAL
jgi:hypothetical protein